MKVALGFSTTNRLMSRLIRWLTGSKISHAWLLITESEFGTPLIMEATFGGVRFTPYLRFLKSNRIIHLHEPSTSIEAGLRSAMQWLASDYDVGGLIGMGFVVFGRWLKRKVKNPFASSDKMFCSEFVVRVLQKASYPGASELPVEETDPQSLYEFVMKT